MMNNALVQQIIATYGDAVFAINLDNTRYIYIGYKDGVQLEDISFETISDEDFIVVSRKDPNPQNLVRFKVYHLTSTVQWIGVMDEGYEDFRIDPIILR